MPKLDFREIKEHKDLTLADVPVGEWWLDPDGIPHQRESTSECVYYNKEDMTFCRSGDQPRVIVVVRKLCDPIGIIWE